MSADPDEPVIPGRTSGGGHVIKNMIYKHQAGNHLEIVTGWSEQGTREFNQEIVPPARERLHPKHPCVEMNQQLVRCSLGCPEEMRLAGRVAACNDERHQLMKCFTKHKDWNPPAPKAWYQLW